MALKNFEFSITVGRLGTEAAGARCLGGANTQVVSPTIERMYQYATFIKVEGL